jgi:flagellin
MSLVITNNVGSLTAQHNLARTSNNLNQSLERLSSGLKINRAADGPAALVISEEQRAQIAGLQTAINNSAKAVSLVQTGEGALNEINSLLVQVRGLALDSANSGVNDAAANAANQAQVSNALATIDRIANNTQFGSKKLLDGSAGINGTASDSNITFLKGTSDASPGVYDINITQAAERAVVKVSQIQKANLSQDENLTLNGVSIKLTAGSTVSQVQTQINQFTDQTGVVAENHALNLTSSTALNTLSGGNIVAADGTTALASLIPSNGTALQAGDVINFSGTTSDGKLFKDTFTVGGGAGQDGTTVQALLDKINGEATGFTASGDALSIDTTANSPTLGHLIVTGKTGNDSLDSQISLNLSNALGNQGTVDFGNLTGDAGETRLRTVQFGRDATISVQSNLATSAAGNTSGFGTTLQTDAGVDVAGRIGAYLATGNGNVLTGAATGGAKGISIAVSGLDTTAAANFKTLATASSPSGTLGTLTVLDNSLNFQIGANAGQTAKVTLGSVKTSALGLGIAGNLFNKLSDIDVRTTQGAQDAISIIDQASKEVTNLRGTLGAFQAQTLQSTSNNLQATLENTTNAESVIRDTDFAAETANFTKNQVLLQAGTTVLSNANQIPQLVLALLK